MIVHSHVKEVWEMENGMKDKVSGGVYSLGCGWNEYKTSFSQV